MAAAPNYRTPGIGFGIFWAVSDYHMILNKAGQLPVEVWWFHTQRRKVVKHKSRIQFIFYYAHLPLHCSSFLQQVHSLPLGTLKSHFFGLFCWWGLVDNYTIGCISCTWRSWYWRGLEILERFKRNIWRKFNVKTKLLTKLFNQLWLLWVQYQTDKIPAQFCRQNDVDNS